MSDLASQLDRFVAAFNRNDLDEIMRHFAEDARDEPGDGTSHRGRAAIRRAFEPQFLPARSARCDSISSCAESAVTTWPASAAATSRAGCA